MKVKREEREKEEEGRGLCLDVFQKN